MQTEVPVKIIMGKKNKPSGQKLEGLILLEPLGGLEPSTRALRMRCSTTELQRRVT